MTGRPSPTPLETIILDVPEQALEAFEAALSSVCPAVGFFLLQKTEHWRLEGVKPVGYREPELAASLALAATLTGIEATLRRRATPASGWLARTHAAFPEQQVGHRFVVRGTHHRDNRPTRRIILTLDAGLAFGSGEHGSTRGCLRALERVAWRRPRHILDLGTGSGILAMAAASLLRRPVLATDIEPWSVRVAQQNAAMNRLRRSIRVRHADGWRHPVARFQGPYDLVLANILARPLCLMAAQLAVHLAPGGTVILSGLLEAQTRMVITAHRRCGLYLIDKLHEGPWATLVMRRPANMPAQ